MKTTITVQGLEEAKAKMKALGYAVDGVVDEAIKTAAEPMRQAVADKAPVKSGRLAAGIKLERHDKGEWRIGPDKYYGYFQELGTVHHSPHPFVRPGFEAERRSTRERFADFIRRVIEGVAR